MGFRFYSNVFSRVSRTVAAVICIAGLILIGFGFMIYLLPKLFATLAAVVFFVTGGSCVLSAVKIFLTQRQSGKNTSGGMESCRKNVRIHSEEHYEE